MEDPIEVVKTQQEVNELIDQIDSIIANEGSRFTGMSYEEGLKEMYDWLTGLNDHNPLEN